VEGGGRRAFTWWPRVAAREHNSARRPPRPRPSLSAYAYVGGGDHMGSRARVRRGRRRVWACMVGGEELCVSSAGAARCCGLRRRRRPRRYDHSSAPDVATAHRPRRVVAYRVISVIQGSCRRTGITSCYDDGLVALPVHSSQTLFLFYYSNAKGVVFKPLRFVPFAILRTLPSKWTPPPPFF
jgi:hypothetical protein